MDGYISNILLQIKILFTRQNYVWIFDITDA